LCRLDLDRKVIAAPGERSAESVEEELSHPKKRRKFCMISRKSLAVFAVLLGVLAAFSTIAFANILIGATGSVDCSGYHISVNAADLTFGVSYTINYTLITTCDGVATSVHGSIPFVAGGSNATETATGTWHLSGNCTVAGSATLTSSGSTVHIVFSPSSMTCQAPPPPPPCLANASNSSNFNGTSVPEGTYIWFNAHFKANNVPSDGVTIDFTKGNIAFTAGGTSYSLNVPNARITFSANATCTSTTFDSITSTWLTTVPVSGDDEVFLTGLAWPVPGGGLAAGANPVNFSGTYSSETSAPGLSIQMVWSAAAYSKFTTNYNALEVKAGHQTACGQNNGDHSGTPEGVDNTNRPWKDYLVGGPRGGGGSNFTGSWSGTLSIPICPR
jgi:hypothetical protein